MWHFRVNNGCDTHEENAVLFTTLAVKTADLLFCFHGGLIENNVENEDGLGIKTVP